MLESRQPMSQLLIDSHANYYLKKMLQSLNAEGSRKENSLINLWNVGVHVWNPQRPINSRQIIQSQFALLVAIAIFAFK